MYKCSRRVRPRRPPPSSRVAERRSHGHAGSRRALLARNMHLTNRIYIIRKASETVSVSSSYRGVARQKLPVPDADSNARSRRGGGSPRDRTRMRAGVGRLEPTPVAPAEPGKFCFRDVHDNERSARRHRLIRVAFFRHLTVHTGSLDIVHCSAVRRVKKCPESAQMCVAHAGFKRDR